MYALKQGPKHLRLIVCCSSTAVKQIRPVAVASHPEVARAKSWADVAASLSLSRTATLVPTDSWVDREFGFRADFQRNQTVLSRCLLEPGGDSQTDKKQMLPRTLRPRIVSGQGTFVSEP